MGRFSFSLFLCCAWIPLYATDYTWNIATGGDWDNNANWTSTPAATYPNSSADTATFGPTNPTSTATISASASPEITLNAITFSTANTCTVTLNGGSFAFAANGSTLPTINVASGNQTISCAIELQANTSVSSSAGLTLSGIISESGGAQQLTIAGGVVLSGANTYSGGTTMSSGITTVSNSAALGTGSVTMQTGSTLQMGINNYLTSQSITLAGNATIALQATTGAALSGVISGAGGLTITGNSTSATINVSGINTYQGGTTVNGGTLTIAGDTALGASTGALTIGSATVSMPAMTSARNISLTSNTSAIAVTGPVSLSGLISGSGILNVSGSNTLTLSGSVANTYNGAIVTGSATLQGNSLTLSGPITNSANLIFNQTFTGTYPGVLSGSGTTTVQGGGPLTLTGLSTFNGTTNVTASSLIVNGSLGGTINVDANAKLSGSGSLGTVVNTGIVEPGTSGSGTMTISDLSFAPGGILQMNLLPTSSGQIAATTADLQNGNLIVTPLTSEGFFGINRTYTIMTGTISNQFSTSTSSNPNFFVTPLYSPTEVQLSLVSSSPFLDFPFENSNERAVGENIDAILAAGALSTDMENVIDALAGQSNAIVSNALDQMHPAALSALAEVQTELGGQILSLFHRKPELPCTCHREMRVWVEPFGNWLKEKRQGEEIGFRAKTRGIAFGYDVQLARSWTIGIGGAWNATDVKWQTHRGYSYANSFYGALYSDLFLDNFYLGLSGYGGADFYDVGRHISFTTIDRHAKSHSHSANAAGQLTASYCFGTPLCVLYPYATVDYLYLRNSSFGEKGANSLNLHVDAYHSSTLRVETGGGWRFIDKSADGHFCITPLISMGYVLELPLHRSHYHSTFQGENISFTTKGWDMAWQLLNLHFGLGIAYRGFQLDSEYIADISPEGGSPFFNQRANFRFSYLF